MSKGGGRKLYDDDDYYDHHDDEYDNECDYEYDNEETSDYIEAVRAKLNAEQNRVITREEIVGHLERFDYDIDRTLKGVREYLKPVKKATSPVPAQSKGKTAPIGSKPSGGSKPIGGGGVSQVGGNKGVVTNVPDNRRPLTLITSPNDLGLLNDETLSRPLPPPTTGDALHTSSASEVTLAVVGHVDAGKSTLVGQLLQKIGLVQARTVQKYEREAQSIGKASFGLAWVMDERSAEREHGVTIDVAERRFSTKIRDYVILDTPGHRDFLPNMIKGAAQADIAILILPASEGEYESAMKQSALTKEHCFLLKALGVHSIIVAINKMDQTLPCPWDRDRFYRIAGEITTFLAREIHFPEERVHCIPVSGITGENLVDISSDCPLQTWYHTDLSPTQVTLVDALDAIRLPGGNNDHSIASADKQQDNGDSNQSPSTTGAPRPPPNLPASTAASSGGSKSLRAIATVLDADRALFDVHVIQGSLCVGAKVGLAVTVVSHGNQGQQQYNSSGLSPSGSGNALAGGHNSSCRLYTGLVRSIVTVPRGGTSSTSDTTVGDQAAGYDLSVARTRDHVIVALEMLVSSSAHNNGIISNSNSNGSSSSTSVSAAAPTPSLKSAVTNSSSKVYHNPFVEEFEVDMTCLVFAGPLLPHQTSSFVATIVTMPSLAEQESIILPGSTFELYLKGVELQCKITQLHPPPGSTLRPKLLREGGKTASVTIQVMPQHAPGVGQQVIVDSFAVCRALGRFALRARGFTVAVGIVDRVLD